MDEQYLAKTLKKRIRDVPDFPKPGIIFKDITPVLADYLLCKTINKALAIPWQGLKIEGVAGIESRGFLFGMTLAMNLKVPFIPIRKKGKLPLKTNSKAYKLEYGSAELEMHSDAISNGDHILIHDDLLATGGTAMAATDLILQNGGIVAGFSFLIMLQFLKGTDSLPSDQVHSLVQY